jgi:hypothetical protein
MSTILASTSQADSATTTTSAFAFGVADRIVAQCTNGAAPTLPCAVTLQLTADGVNWKNIDTRVFGFAPSQTYYQQFELANYAGSQVFAAANALQVLSAASAQGWTQFRLVFGGNAGAAVTIAATGSDVLSMATVPVTGVAATTGGAMGSWVPPEGGPIIITNMVLYCLTNSTGAANVSAGVAANATTSAASLINAQALAASANTAIFSGTGTSATVGSILTGSQAVTFTGSATTAGFTGKAYIFYVRP